MGDFWWSVELTSDSSSSLVSPAPASLESNFEVLSVVADLSGSIGAELLEEDRKDGKDGKVAILRAAYVSSQDISYWLSILEDLLENFPGVQVRSYSKIENRPWHTEHLEAFPPLPVGVNFVVMAPWHKGKEPAGKVPIYINPSSAFGTGYHESTQIALSLLERFVKPGSAIFDVGTGSGVLFIAALKWSAALGEMGRAAACDIDPTAIAEARRNMELNDLPPESCELRVGDLLEGWEELSVSDSEELLAAQPCADILTSNILLEPNIRLLGSACRVLKKESGVAIFSGMTVSERAKFLSMLEPSGLSLLSEMTLNDWWGCAVQS